MAKTKKSFDYGDPFPSRFRNLIEKKGATLDALATEFNTTRQTVSNWQNGVTVPDAVSICDIACSICTRMLINAEIKRIVYDSDYSDPLSKKMLEESGIEVVKYQEK